MCVTMFHNTESGTIAFVSRCFMQQSGTMDSKTRKLLKLLKNRREQEGLSLRALSDLIGISFSTLSRLEKDDYDAEPDANTRARIINWLGDESEKAGINFKESALVHFRAKKNPDPKTIECLLEIAELVKKQYGNN